MVSQLIQISISGQYELQYYHSCHFVSTGCLQFWLNNALISNITYNTCVIQVKRLKLVIYPGAYIFKFNQISNLYNGNYAIIDNISLNFLSPLPNSFVDVFTHIIVLVISVPIPSISALNYLYFLLNDIWLYSYDVKDYKGIVK